MSKTIDERVVEMRFDNRQFERNVSTTMSTLDKLKQKLNFTGASKGLENIGSAVKKVDMTGMANGVESVRARFSALDVMAVTALANITNSAVNAGKRIASALTIDPIKTGFQEYETQMNAVQTILANTQSKGSTLDDVNKALDTLNTYADKTIYNFTEMTRNIGTFTAAGVDLQTSVDSIQGIANLAAVSGSTSQQASTAMYQLSQALAAGKVSLMDWNSVVNAGMGGELFQNALIRTSELLKTGAKDAINTYGSFRESLTKGEWLTTEVLTETLKQLSGAYTEAELIAQGYTKEQAKEITQLAKTASDAATKVKTFSQLWDVMKESAQSGWAQTWKLIIGDFEQAKALLTPLADFMTGAINKMSEARNKLLESALGKGFSHMFEGLNSVLGTTKKGLDGVLKPVKSVSKALESLDVISDKVIGGSFGNGKERFDALTEAGYNWCKVQNKVNEKLGNSHRYTEEQIAAQDKLIGKTGEATEKTKEQADATIKLTDENKKQLKNLAALSDERLKELGYSKEQIEALRELREQADALGLSVSDFVDNLDQINGRWLLINSFKNIGQGIVAVFKAMGEAWKEIFPPMTADQLFNIIGGFHKLTTYLKVNEDAAEKFKRTFKGVFAALDIVLTIVGGPIKIAFKALTQLLGMFDMNILDLTANIGDAIVKFRDWIDSTLDFTKVFEAIIPVIKNVARRIHDWFIDLKNSDIGQAIIDGLTNGLKDGALKAWNAAVDITKKLVEKVKEVLGIHSPSTVFFDIGQNIIEGLVNGVMAGIGWIIKAAKMIWQYGAEAFTGGKDMMVGFGEGIKKGASVVWEFLSGIASKIMNFIKGLDFGTVLAAGLSSGILFTLVKIGKVVSAFSSPFEGIGSILENVGDVVGEFGGVLKSFSKSIKAKALKDIAIALAILVGSVIALTLVDSEKVDKAVKVIATLALIIGALSFVMGKVGKVTEGLGGMVTGLANIAKISGLILSVSLSMLLMAGFVKIISGVEWTDMDKATAGVLLFGGLIAAILGLSKFTKKHKDLKSVSKLIRSVATTMLLLALTAKLIATMSWGDMAKAGVGLMALAGVVAGLVFLSKMGGKNLKHVGKTIRGIGTAMLLLVVVAKLIAGMSWGDMGKAMIGLMGLSAIIGILISTTKLATDKELKGIGITLMGIGSAMLLLAMVGKVIADMSWSEMGKAGVGILALAGIIVGLIYATKLASPGEMKRIGSTLLMMSISIGILAGVAMMLSLMNVKALAKGVVAVGILGSIMAAMIWATRGAENCKGNLIVMTVAIGIMTAAVVALSLVDGDKLAGATIAIGTLMGMFALIAKTAGSAKGSMGTLIVLSGVVAMLAFIVLALSKTDAEAALKGAVGLSLLMVALASTFVIISKAGIFAGVAVKTLPSMLIVVAGLAAILAAMSFLPNPDALIPAAASLSLLLTALAVSMVILSGVGPMAGMAVQPAMLMGLVVGELAIVLGLLTTYCKNVDSLLPVAASLSMLLLALAAACVILIPVGATGPAAIIGAAVLAGVIAILGLVAIAIGELMHRIPADKIEEWKSGIAKFMDLLSALAYGLGKVVGSFVGGVLDGVMSGLPAIGTHLSDFISNAQPFINGVKTVDGSVLKGVGILAAAILALTAVDLVNSIASFLSFGGSFADLGSELSMFMTNAMPFIIGSRLIDPTVAEGVRSLAQAILILTAADVINGIASFLGGGSSLADFGKQLEVFGPSMKAYSQAVAGIDTEAVTASANAAKTLAEMAKKIPNEGGLLGKIFGENSVDTFGTQIEAFGSSLKAYSVAVTGLNAEAIEVSTEAATGLSKMASSIPNLGGVVSWFAGENSLVTFGQNLVSFGRSLKLYGATMVGLQTEAIASSVKATNSLSKMAADIPNIGGVVSWFAGDNSLAAFGTNIVSFGKSLKTYSITVLGVLTASIDNSVKAASKLAGLAKAMPEDGGFWSWLKSDKVSLSEFGDEIIPLGEAMASYSEKVAGINLGNINGSVSAAKSIVKLIKGLVGLDTSGIATFKSAVASLGEVSISSFIDAFNAASGDFLAAGVRSMTSVITGMRSQQSALNYVAANIANTASGLIRSRDGLFRVAGMMLMVNLIMGITSKRGQVISAVSSVVSVSVAGLTSYYFSFYNAGSFLVSGFAAGISANSYRAEAKAAAMAKAAAQAAEDELDINSPSKVFRKIGTSIPEGFAMGIDKMGWMVKKSAISMAEVSMDGVNNAIASIASIINSDIDAQPTIRPVMDLSDIRAGAGAIGGMFGSPIATANVSAISSMMNRRSQNGTTEEVVSAINKLRKDLGNVGGTSYNINGITYSGDSELDEAFKTIVRHAKIERRV